VLYAASFGPTCWLASHVTHRHEHFDTAYWPIGYAMYNGGACVSRPLTRYGELGMPAGGRWHLRAEVRRDFDSASFVLVGKCPL
jgi:hypothetical protein